MTTDVTETERRAAEIVYEHDHGQKLAYDDIPEEERDEILKRIRARVARIEQFVTHDMLVRKIGEQRWNPVRFTRPAALTAVIMSIVILIGMGVIALFSRH